MKKVYFRELTSRELPRVPTCLSFVSCEGKWCVAVGTAEGAVILYDTTNLAYAGGFESGLESVAAMDAMVREEKLIVAGDPGLCVINFIEDEAFELAPALRDYLFVCRVTQDGEGVLCAGSDEQVRCVELSTGAMSVIGGSGEATTSISVHPDNDQFLYLARSDSGDCDVVFMSLTREGSGQTAHNLKFQGAQAAFSPCGNFYVVIDHYVRVFKFPDHALLWAFSEKHEFLDDPETHNWDVSTDWTQPCFSSDSELLFCAAPSGKLYCFGIQSRSVLGAESSGMGNIRDLDVLWVERKIATVSSKGILKMWGVEGL